MTSVVLILSEANRDAGNAFGVDQGWGDNTFSAPLSGNGREPATHWGCRADIGPSFIEMVENPSPENEALVAMLIYSFEDNVAPYGHWVKTLSVNGLSVVVAPEVT